MACPSFVPKAPSGKAWLFLPSQPLWSEGASEPCRRRRLRPLPSLPPFPLLLLLPPSLPSLARSPPPPLLVLIRCPPARTTINQYCRPPLSPPPLSLQRTCLDRGKKMLERGEGGEGRATFPHVSGRGRLPVSVCLYVCHYNRWLLGRVGE